MCGEFVMFFFYGFMALFFGCKRGGGLGGGVIRPMGDGWFFIYLFFQ